MLYIVRIRIILINNNRHNKRHKMNYEQYLTAKNNNTKILNECLAKWDFVGLNKIQFWEQPKRVSIDILGSKIYDIIGCCTIGAIPSIKKNGADGYAYFKDHKEPQEVETKVAGIESDSVSVGPSGGLYRRPGDNMLSKPAGITSALGGKFDANMSESTRATKSRYTALICFDRDHNQIIDAWMMNPDIVATSLHNRKSSNTLTLKLGCFINSGWAINTPVNKIGWDNWKQMQVKLKK